ncbi:methionine ABC transporter ATP-binding protein [Clostridium sp. MSJ-8]|uniref:methionine ABC transporter ATP-binding protein n=1 Tax=Clostridium sp. MSJ-8 TaxID=2841510 RepID=UPI001C0EBE49|nr:methionine ABC transporter ATP-binding protein [Clostridium sp. MSJ-8]MBU5487340.1 methionine ABC transporter ATP-binding protein [Clostridium sp. MSJ-8]
MINIQNLQKNYGEVKILKDISLTIQEGDICGIIGHSGAGKSTLLRCINGLEEYNAGSIKVYNREIKDLSGKELREFRKDIGMIFQNFNLLERKTVFDNIALPLQVWKADKELINKRVNELLKLVSLEEKAHMKPKALSGGQKQRVAIARALALNPSILLCDEATSALDPKTTKDILALLSRINKELGITIVMITHQMEVIKDICNNIVLIDDGCIVAEGTSEDIFLRPGLSVKKFLGEDDEIIKDQGIYIKIFFPADCSENALITKMARELNLDFSIVYGKLEKIQDKILGNLVINICERDIEGITKYLNEKNILWERL